MSEKTRTNEAIEALKSSQIERRTAGCHEEHGNHVEAYQCHQMANLEEQRYDELMQPDSSVTVSNGEVIPDGKETKDIFIRDTLKNLDSAALDASLARTNLLLQDHLDVLAIGIDATNSLDDPNSLEKMLLHQASASHIASMELMNQAMARLNKLNSYNSSEREQASIHCGRLLNSYARVTSSYQQSLLTLHKLRNGGKQTVTVQHVNVESGGQAV
ncbi:hypothetical protein BOW18_12105, partial [Solemya velum gill symbiont]